MQLMQQFYSQAEPDGRLEDGQLLLRIQGILHSQAVPFRLTANSPKQLAAIISLRPRLAVPRLLSSFWVFSVDEQLEIQVQLAEGQEQPAIEISPQVTSLLKSLNATSHGLYFLKGNAICFRTRIPFQTSKRTLHAQIKEAYLEVSQHFGRYALAVKLVEGMQEVPSRKITDTLQRLRELKQQFEFTRWQRTRSTRCYNLSNSHIKLVSEALALVNLSFARLKLYARENKFDLNRCHKVYAAVRKTVEQGAVKEAQKLQRTIVRGIEIESISGEEVIDKGGFSLIRRGIYQFEQLLTFNNYNERPCNNSTPPIPNPESPPGSSNNLEHSLEEEVSRRRVQDMEAKKRILVRKMPIDQQDPNFSNEVELLKFIRNQKCPSIAEFFLSSTSRQPTLDSSIYMQYYQANLARVYQQLKQKDLLRVSRQILQGIYFLWQNRILHRDLKELNVLIDQAGNAKIIDFGSASGFHGNAVGQFRSSHNKLMTTKGYFCSYNTVDIPAVTSKFDRDQFHQAQTFDMYSFGQILHNLFQLEHMQDGLVERELLFLARKCQETNPDDRIFPLEALCYLREIITLFTQEITIQKEGEEAELPQPPKRLASSTSQQ